jgi:hypothetical protein
MPSSRAQTSPSAICRALTDRCRLEGGDAGGHQLTRRHLVHRNLARRQRCVKFTSRQTKQAQTFAAAPDAPLLAGFVQVLIQNTCGRGANVRSIALEGEGWG